MHNAYPRRERRVIGSRHAWLLVVGAVIAFGPVGCAGSPGADELAERVGRALSIDVWWTKAAIEADITIELGGATMLDGRMLFELHGQGRSRIELTDGTLMVFDGREAWVSPAASEVPMARFHLLTWSYFLAAPMKLRDPGTHLESLGRMELQGRSYETVKLTFDTGVGDAPDDWYICYVDPATDRLRAMAYIVTYGKPRAEAEKEPHIITYHGERVIDGEVLPLRWHFWHWNAEQGAHGKMIGRALLRNAQFVDPLPDAFTKPENARNDPLPGAAE